MNRNLKSYLELHQPYFYRKHVRSLQRQIRIFWDYPLGVKYLTKLRIGFNHLKEHKHNFQDSIDQCAAAVLVLKQRFIFFFIAQIVILKDKPCIINIINTLSFGKSNSENSFNKAMVNASIEFILSTERFNNPLFWC